MSLESQALCLKALKVATETSIQWVPAAGSCCLRQPFFFFSGRFSAIEDVHLV